MGHGKLCAAVRPYECDAMTKYKTRLVVSMKVIRTNRTKVSTERSINKLKQHWQSRTDKFRATGPLLKPGHRVQGIVSLYPGTAATPFVGHARRSWM